MKTATARVKSRSKSQIVSTIAEDTGLSRKQVSSVFESMTGLIRKDLGKKGPGIFTLPGLCKMVVQNKPATKGGVKPNPFKPGEMMQVKPRPARRVVKVRPLKNLKAMA